MVDYFKRNLYYMAIDFAIVIASFFLAGLFYQPYQSVAAALFSAEGGRFLNPLVAAAVLIAMFYSLGIYKNMWPYATFRDCYLMVAACVAASLLTLGLRVACETLFLVDWFGIRINILAMLFSTIGTVGLRIAVRSYALFGMHGRRHQKNSTKLLIVGAGSAARMFISDLLVNHDLIYDIVGLVDDDPAKQNTIFAGKRVLGTRDDIVHICASKEVDEILIAMPSAGDMEIRKMVEICSKTDCKVRILPSISQTIEYAKEYRKKIREVQIEDLLAREPVMLNNHEIVQVLEGKTVLVSGGGGSIGSELCRQIAAFNPQKLIIVDIYENNAYDLQTELKMVYPFLNMVVLIASVRDVNRMEQIFETHRPDIVFHAAAHKHVPLMEDSPGEAVKNNVFGTLNLAVCADKFHVEKFVLISTDKAVNPTNVMGATKRICEMIVQSFQPASKTEFVAVRFGNVLGSNGSVIPLFKRQIQNGGPVTVTHREITRFFMTITEATQLVLQASYYAKGGEIFVLDMGEPVKIYDLAVNLIRLSGYKPNVDIEIKITGLRPGEKLYEEILMDEEGLQKTAHSKIFVGQPIFCDYDTLKRDLAVLKSAADSGDEASVINAISKIVPTYRHSAKQKPAQEARLDDMADMLRT